MKAGIITWHQEINHGAVLQAYALQRFLESNNCEVVLLDHSRSLISMDDRFLVKLKRRIKKLTPQKIRDVYKTKEWNAEKRAIFTNFRNMRINAGESYSVSQELDIAVIGSDMVFDFYEGYNPYAYGINVASPHIISYAASFGYTTKDLLDSFYAKEEISNGLKAMDAIGCRDNNSIALASALAPGKQISKNIDPVLLYGFQEEARTWVNDSVGDFSKPYILVYSYSFNMDSKDEVNAVRSLAKSLNCEVISIGYWHAWCDRNINADPELFVRLFSNARFVVTDTFHGTVFSLLFNRQFRTVIRKNSFKVCDLLEDLKATEFIARDANSIASASNNIIDYSSINLNIDAFRMKSADYLLSELSRAGKTI